MADLPSRMFIHQAQRDVDAVARGDITIDEISSDVLDSGRAHVCWRTDTWDDAADGWVVLDYDQMLAQAVAQAADRRSRRQPTRYVDETWTSGSGAAVRQGYDGTQMPGRDYD
jgi:hypothetical protein